MTSRTAQKRGSDSKWEKVYADALAIEAEAPGTVCTSRIHYIRDHRHPEPYRIGFVHHYRMPNEHWHANEKSYRGCEQ